MTPFCYNTRLILELYNERGELLRRRISTCKNMHESIVNSWRKQYGKKFDSLTIKELKNNDNRKHGK